MYHSDGAWAMVHSFLKPKAYCPQYDELPKNPKIMQILRYLTAISLPFSRTAFRLEA